VNPRTILFPRENLLTINDIENVSVSVSKYFELQRTAANAHGRKALQNVTS
jgi:hypothetical protein